MPTRLNDSHAPALVALRADASVVCAARLAKVTGTHALALDGLDLPTPAVDGVACWTRLQPCASGTGWIGPLRAGVDVLPFVDESFCVVLLRFVDLPSPSTETLAVELARVLAPHGILLIAGLHPRSLWHAGAAPGRWEHALRHAGLEVFPTARCGSPWPRVHGAAGMPRWLVRGMGGGFVIEARRRTQPVVPLRKAASRRTLEQPSILLPGAHRQRA